MSSMGALRKCRPPRVRTANSLRRTRVSRSNRDGAHAQILVRIEEDQVRCSWRSPAYWSDVLALGTVRQGKGGAACRTRTSDPIITKQGTRRVFVVAHSAI